MGLLGKLFKGKEEDSRKPVRDDVKWMPGHILSPLNGTAIPMEEIPDPVFAGGTMGGGCGIEPEEGKLYAPVDGVIESIFPTGHALGIRADDGIEILLHIGVDTVQMKGDGFQALVKEGEKVKAGELLIQFDIAKIKSAGYASTTAVLVTNMDEAGTLKNVHVGAVKPMDNLYEF